MGSSHLSPIFEENFCSRSAEKKGVTDSTYAQQSSANKCLSFAPESSIKKIIVVLDEDDDKLKRQYQARRISARWKKDIRIYYPKRYHPESVELCLSEDWNAEITVKTLNSPVQRSSRQPTVGEKGNLKSIKEIIVLQFEHGDRI